MFLGLASGAWIFVVLGISGMLGLMLLGGYERIIAILAWRSASVFILVAVPLFIYMGNILLVSGATDNLYTGLSVWLSPLPGGLIHTNIGACAIFAAISGSSTATTATIGSVAIPELEKRGYDRGLIMGSIAGAGTLGILIPPSINMIIYGAWMEVSVARLFMGGVVPGIMLVILFMLYVMCVAIRNPQRAPRGKKPTPRAMFLSIKKVGPTLFIIAVILGSIYTGVATPTEVAAIGCGLAFLLATLYRTSWKLLWQATKTAVDTTCMILIIYVCAQVFAHCLIRLGITTAIGDFIQSGKIPEALVMPVIYFMYIVLGCFLDGLSMMLVTLPIVEPVLTTLGINLIWYGIILILLTELAMLTPPVGFNLFVILGIVKGSTIGQVALSCLPYALLLLIGLMIFTVFPQLVLWLPNTMG